MAIIQETVTSIHHWNDKLFSFSSTRQKNLTFENGQFLMLGLEIEGKPLMRAYSIASANYDDHMEFFSIKVPDGRLTSHLANIKPGDQLLVNTKTTGSLLPAYLLPGKRLYLLATGTGLAPFMSIIKNPEIYEQYEKIILVHGVRTVSELAYQQEITQHLPNNPYFGELVTEKLIYYPTVTREPFHTSGRITQLISDGKLFADIGAPALSPEHDRFMLCGSPDMLRDTLSILQNEGFTESRHGKQAHIVIERAFVENSR